MCSPAQTRLSGVATGSAVLCGRKICVSKRILWLWRRGGDLYRLPLLVPIRHYAIACSTPAEVVEVAEVVETN